MCISVWSAGPQTLPTADGQIRREHVVFCRPYPTKHRTASIVIREFARMFVQASNISTSFAVPCVNCCCHHHRNVRRFLLIRMLQAIRIKHLIEDCVMCELAHILCSRDRYQRYSCCFLHQSWSLTFPTFFCPDATDHTHQALDSWFSYLRFGNHVVFKRQIPALPWLFPSWSHIFPTYSCSSAAGHTHQPLGNWFGYLRLYTHAEFKHLILALPWLFSAWVLYTEISDVFLFWCCRHCTWLTGQPSFATRMMGRGTDI